MKIINTDSLTAERVKRDREQTLDQSLIRIYAELGLSAPVPLSWPVLLKGLQLELLEAFQSIQQLYKAKTESKLDQVDNRTFTSFPRLPLELRLRIWQLLSLDHVRPRIHVIDAELIQIVSNQPISPLLHVCSESREEYISLTKTQFAFETYINFDIDAVYLRNRKSVV